MNSGTKRSDRARILALLSVFLAVQLGQWLHHSSERHVRCAEHGEWVHAPDGAGSGELASAGRASPDGPSLVPLAPAETPHEHCELASIDRERALPRSAAFDLVWPASPVSQVRVIDAAPRAAAIPSYALAPKQSPPC
jgi:hypothetical protein